MSDASNLGYGNMIPNSNVNNSFVNVSATNNPAIFSSNETGLAASGGHGMLGQSNNVAAANSCLGGLCNMTSMQKGGGAARHKKYNRTLYYRTRKHSRKMSSRRRRHHSRRHRRTRRHRGGATTNTALNRKIALYNRRMAALSRKLARSQSRRGGAMAVLAPASIDSGTTLGQKGGYHQYMGNIPSTPSYSVAGVNLGAANSALANPAPFSKLGCEGSSCVDNYNHYTNKGFQLWN